jgi:3-phosphoshikimate 1-carboxyvinyltransferase
LLLSERIGGWNVSVAGGNDEELPYVDMTRRLLNDFPWRGGTYDVEPDASGASYFWGADWLLRDGGSRITVMSAPTSGMQRDQKFYDLIVQQAWRPAYSRRTDLADSIMTAIVLAPFALGATRFTDLGRLRVQECERVRALRTELTKCGARVEEVGDTLTVHPGALHGAEIETYNDHRIAMCFAMLGCVCPESACELPRACARPSPTSSPSSLISAPSSRMPRSARTFPEMTCWRSGAGLVQVSSWTRNGLRPDYSWGPFPI